VLGRILFFAVLFPLALHAQVIRVEAGTAMTTSNVSYRSYPTAGYDFVLPGFYAQVGYDYFFRDNFGIGCAVRRVQYQIGVKETQYNGNDRLRQWFWQVPVTASGSIRVSKRVWIPVRAGMHLSVASSYYADPTVDAVFYSGNATEWGLEAGTGLRLLWKENAVELGYRFLKPLNTDNYLLMTTRDAINSNNRMTSHTNLVLHTIGMTYCRYW
jgi:hypothetical protein